MAVVVVVFMFCVVDSMMRFKILTRDLGAMPISAYSRLVLALFPTSPFVLSASSCNSDVTMSYQHGNVTK